MKTLRTLTFSSLAWLGVCLLIAPWAVRGDVARTTASSSGGVSSGSALTVNGQSGVAAAGSDVVTNGTFTGNATGWTLGAGGGAPDWAYASNTVTHGNGGGTTALQPSSALTIVVGTRYLVKWTISSYVAGTLNVTIGGASISAPTRANGSYQAVLIATTTGNLLFTPTTTLDCTLDTISVQAVTPTTPALTFTSTSTYPTEFRQGGAALANFFLGQNAGASDSTGSFNLGLGHDNLNGMMTGVGDVAVGSNALEFAALGSFNIAIGTSALRSHLNGNDNIAIGSNALTNHTIGASNVAIGKNAASSNFTGTDNVNIGQASGTAGTGSFNVLVGSTTDSSTFSYCVGLGYGVACTASNQGQIGSSAANAGITELYVGQGVQKGSPAGVAVRATGGSSSDNAGGNLALAGGASTGTGRGGDLILQTAPSASGTSSSLNSLTDRQRVVAKAVALTDGATTIFTITGLGAHVRTGGSFEFCVQAGDGTNDQVACCRTQWAAVDTTAGAGGETCTNLLDKTCTAALEGAASSGTLAVTADATTGTDTCNYRITPAGSLSESVYNVYYTVIKQLPSGTINPQ